jgi:hypothetical protein
MNNPYRPLARAGTGTEAFQNFPAPYTAVRRITSENATASSVITLNDNTVQLEIAAVGAPVAIKWIPTTDTQASVVTIAGATSNYDHVIPSGVVRQFAVPLETRGTASIAGANIMNGLYQRVAWKTIGVGSIMSSEF